MRNRFFFGVAAAAIVAALSVGLVVGLASGCSSAKTVGAGSECFQAIDCDPGLVCAPTAKGSDKRVCTNDLTNLVSTEDAAADAGARPGDAAADGSRPRDGGQDAAPPVDGAPPDDSGSPPADSGGD